MREPVEQRGCQLLIAEDLDPACEMQIHPHNHRHPLVKRREELEHQLGTGGRERDEAQLVRDDQAMFEGGGQEPGQAVLFLGLG